MKPSAASYHLINLDIMPPASGGVTNSIVIDGIVAVSEFALFIVFSSMNAGDSSCGR